MKRWRLLAAITFGLSVLPACGPTGSGELVTEDRDVGEFDSIEVGGGGRFVEVSVASLQRLAASGGTEVTGEGASDVLDPT